MQNITVMPQNRSGSPKDTKGELEQEGMKSDIKEPSQNSTSHVSSLSAKVGELSKTPSVNTSLPPVVKSSSTSLAISNRTVASEVPASNSIQSKLCKCIKKQPEKGICFNWKFFFLFLWMFSPLCDPINSQLSASFLFEFVLFMLKLLFLYIFK